MSRVWFTSDTHFGHANVVNLDRAPFPNIETRDRFILEAHNAVVGPNDDVYHLGDVAFTQEHLDWYLSNANGKIHLIRGNHDDRIAWRSRRFHSKHEALYIRQGGHRIYLCHYACRVWRNSFHGAYHLYGHSHGNLPGVGRSMDVGVACNDYRPVSLEDVHARLGQIALRVNHHPEPPRE